MIDFDFYLESNLFENMQFGVNNNPFVNNLSTLLTVLITTS